MNSEEILIKCFLCPGLCISECPIYSVTRDRSTAPNVIARSAYHYIKHGLNILAENILECLGCNRCADACPLDNPLPEAIRIIRRRLVGLETHDKLEIYRYGYGEPIHIYSPREPDSGVVNVIIKRGYQVVWIDTRKTHRLYSYGYIDGIDPEKPYLMDDIEVVTDYIDYIKSLENIIRFIDDNVIDNYTLHIPCRLSNLERELVEVLAKYLGNPVEIIMKCSGGGLLYPEHNPKYASKIAESSFKQVKEPIITLCFHSKQILSNMGLKTFSILDVLRGGIK